MLVDVDISLNNDIPREWGKGKNVGRRKITESFGDSARFGVSSTGTRPNDRRPNTHHIACAFVDSASRPRRPNSALPDDNRHGTRLREHHPRSICSFRTESIALFSLVLVSWQMLKMDFFLNGI